MQEGGAFRYSTAQRPRGGERHQDDSEATVGKEQPRRRPETPKSATVVQPRRRAVTGRSLARALFSREALREAILLHEILDQPVSLKNRGRF